jgi:3-methyladenine DNA glycosylase AlkD
MIHALRADLKAAIIPEKAAFLPRFFKTGPGEYGEGDQFLGVTVPEQRRIARHYQHLLSEDEWQQLLASPWHEERLTGIFILVAWYKKAKGDTARHYLDLLLEQLYAGRINNWDLIDSCAYEIPGHYLLRHAEDMPLLDQLADSGQLWQERMAMVATMAFARKGDAGPTLRLAEKFLTHPHDLMHKASGWLLREAGNKNPDALLHFLDQHAAIMPRTMLRYAIEKLPPALRTHYLEARKKQA